MHMTRWIQEITPNDFDVVADTIIAGWWPFTFYRVMTWKTKGPFETAFVTTVQKTDRYGFAKSEHPQFEIKHSDKAQARYGHDQIVAAVAQGKRSRRYLERCLERTQVQ